MQFTKQVFGLAVAAALCGASPIMESRASIVAREDSVTVCHNTNFGAPCIFAPNSGGVCHNVSGSDNDKISSIKLGANTKCIFFADFGCSGGSLFVTSDIPDLRPFGFNDKISSFTCFN